MVKGSVHHKERFLNNIAKSLGRNRIQKEVNRPKWRKQPQYDVFKGESQDELVERLKAHCTHIHTDVIQVPQRHLNESLDKIVNELQGESIVYWDDPRFDEYGLTDYLNDSTSSVHRWDPELGQKNVQIAEQAHIGITFSDITLAESGTVVLLSDQGKGRSVSLLPTYYVAIIPKSTIVPRMTQATEMLHNMQQEEGYVPSCVNFISGPSNSADIEMNLVVGVHGPIRAYYMIVEDR
ncbi:lactate utilization protein C [Halalkalibacter sp. APA_J-10(15)]|uniref:LutC/YkgG family protein n=1 Tax=Halalkalibacter sp. APA_J-10(15) TaxID=2933805 RepID=UPI001FF622F5|nr:lactate utilization protein C [Halalkalibacter sp. APA_J-10(15)]MCK0472916.1 lactate utilization protein C [Halalkalibacter sp. APA_J-10(15)]